MVSPPRDFESRASTNSAIPAGGTRGTRERSDAAIIIAGACRSYNRAVHLSDFDYVLPPELIAQHPATERTASRLLHVRRDGVLDDLRFPQIARLLDPRDVLVVNDTRVIKARLHGRKDTGGEVEVLVERVLDAHRALAMIRSSKTVRVGRRLRLAGA